LNILLSCYQLLEHYPLLLLVAGTFFLLQLLALTFFFAAKKWLDWSILLPLVSGTFYCIGG
jgi:hypothetical protein